MKTGELSISIVDDDEMFLTSLKHFLQQKFRSPINIKLFHTGEEFLKDLSEQKSDIVILDYILNNSRPYAMDGYAVLQKIKQLNPEMTVIMLSGQNRIEVAIQSIKDGAYDYIVKNDTVFLKIQTVLKNAINSTLASKRLERYRWWYIRIGLFFISAAIIIFLLKIFFLNQSN
ncbi:MAG: response regulator [Bacteroidia bacterium]